jgi:hypothetical protein
MTANGEENTSSWSPTCEWEMAKIRRPPQRQTAQPRRGVLWGRLSRRDPRKPLAVSLEWRGGAEAWIKVTGRGGYRNYPGYATLADVLLDINNAH